MLQRPILKPGGLIMAIAVLSAALACVVLAAQSTPDRAPAESILAAPVEPSGETATLTYFNRPIVALRAKILGRRPTERTALAVRVLDNLVATGHTRAVDAKAVGGAILIEVGNQLIVGLTPADIDDLAGETLQAVSDQTVARLQQALDEAAEARRPGMLVRAAARALAMLGIAFLLLRVLGRTRRLMVNRLSTLARRAVTRTGLADHHALRATDRLDYVQRRLVTIVFVGLQLVVVYALVTFTLRQFLHRPWGESLRESLWRRSVISHWES